MTTLTHPPDAVAIDPLPIPPAKLRPSKIWQLPSDQVMIALLILLTIALYANTLFNGFVYDDEQQILQNPYVKNWHYLPQIFGSTVWSFVGAAGATNYYRPMMTFTFLLLWQLFGDIPFGFHLFNVALNAAVVVLVFSAGRRLFRDRRIALLAAILFAILPVHTEVADWIAAVPELEATFFLLLAFWLFTQLDRPSIKIYLGTIAAFALALLSKEPALMFAPIAIVFEHFVRPIPDKDPAVTAAGPISSFVAKIRRYAPVCAVAAAYLILRIALFGKLAPVLQHPKITWLQAIYSAFALVAGYTKYLFWPSPLSAFHVFHPRESFTEIPVLLGFSVVIIAITLILYLYKHAPATAFCIFWMGITIAPMLNARWMAANVFTERYLYLPSVGFCWLLARCGISLWDRRGVSAIWTRRILAATFAAIVTLSVATILPRNLIWRDDMTLYTRTLETNPAAAVIRSNLGALYFDAGQLDRARAEWELALAQKPDNVVTMNALGILYTRQARYPEAAVMFQRAMAAKPLWGDVHFSYASLLEATGDMPSALKEFQSSVSLAPLSGAAHRWYGEALEKNGQLDEAAAQLKLAVDLEDSLDAMHDLADVYTRQGRTSEAEPVLRRILARFPYDSSAHLSLAQVLENSGKPDEALHEYQQVLATDSANTQAQDGVQRLNR